MNEVRFQYSIRTLLLLVCTICTAIGVSVGFPAYWLEVFMTAVVMICGLLVFGHESPFAFYLRFVNPLVAFAILAICLYAASTEVDKGRLTYEGFFKGAIPSYFLAKELFCSSAVFLLGTLVEVTMVKGQSQ